MVDNRELYNKLKETKEKLDFLKKESDELSDKCTHNYLLIYDKCMGLIGGEITSLYCLVCNKNFTYNGIINGNKVKDICVIDIVDKTKKLNCAEYILNMIENNMLVSKNIKIAQDIFDKYFSDEYKLFGEDYLKFMIKKDILKSICGKDIEVECKNDKNIKLEYKKRRGK